MLFVMKKEYKSKVLVHLHIYYYDQLKMFIKRLKAIEDSAFFTIALTISETLGNHFEIEKTIKKSLKHVDLIKTGNRGFDVGPFIEVLHHYDLDDFDYILKLHTKNRNNDGRTILNDIIMPNSAWENIMVDALIGSRKRFHQAISAMDNEKVGMVSASVCIIKDDSSRRNYYFYRVNDELSKIGLKELSEVDDFRFSAGTMFMVRSKLLKPLLSYTINDFGINFAGIHDFTLAHVFERLFAGLVISQNQELFGLRSRSFRNEIRIANIRKKIKDREDTDQSLVKDAYSVFQKIYSRFLFHFKQIEIIRNSKYFDKNWYIRRYPEVVELNIQPEEHYLIHGNELGCNPSPLFNGYEYLYSYPDLVEKKINPLLHYECYGKYEGRKVFDNIFKWNTKIESISKSEYFDEEWYLNNNPDVRKSGMEPAYHYYMHGGFEGRDPSPLFSSNEYLSIHTDVKQTKINPLLHFEYDGFFQGREISSLELKEPSFPADAIETSVFFKKYPPEKGRTAIVATYSSDGYIDDSLIYLLKGLREVTDNIILIGDSPIFKSELNKLKDTVTYVSYRRRGQYTFGSYKEGLCFARENGYLDEKNTSELIMMDDSCYGPVYPFAESFDQMKSEIWDFWGYVGNQSIDFYICSFFYVFNRKIIDSKLLDEFMNRVVGKVDRSITVAELETKLTDVLIRQNMISRTYVSEEEQKSIDYRNILSLLRDYKIPLIKKRAINGDTKENIEASLKIIEKHNPELYRMIRIQPISTAHRVMKLEEYRNSLFLTVERIRKKIINGEKVKSIFLVPSTSMFPARPLFNAMQKNELFDAFIAVIPDLHSDDIYRKMKRCENELLKAYSGDRIIRIRKDRYERLPDVLKDADLAIYPSPINISEYKYNVRYALGRSFLPLIVNPGFYRSISDRSIMSSYNYAYYWKVFMECSDTMQEYQEYSVLKGENSEISGYIKMDGMADIIEKKRDRKRILLALHHSADDETDRSMSLASFIRYYDYFKNLPDRYPEIDFVYRPHALLFDELKSAMRWDDRKTDSFFQRIKNKKNVIWSSGGDYFDEFVNSDGCIQDRGSFLVEYLYTGKPCCYMLKTPEDIETKFTPLGKKCLEQCYISYNTVDIDHFIQDVILGGNDSKKNRRLLFSKEVMVNYPHAADFALESIKKSILGK